MEKISLKKLQNFMEQAEVISKLSKDIHTKVGCKLINPDNLNDISSGYNGYIRNAPDNKLPSNRPDKYNYTIHAEQNAICNAARLGNSTNGAICICTLSPCKSCMRSLWQSGISTIYFKDIYKTFEEDKMMLDLNYTLTKVGEYYKLKLKAGE